MAIPIEECTKLVPVFLSLMDYLKYTKRTPSRPIVYSRSSFTYRVAKEFTRILKPLAGKYVLHGNSTQNFIEDIKSIILRSGKCITSYDVTVLVNSVPLKPSRAMFKHKL